MGLARQTWWNQDSEDKLSISWHILAGEQPALWLELETAAEMGGAWVIS